jgi:hypothetical protein
VRITEELARCGYKPGEVRVPVAEWSWTEYGPFVTDPPAFLELIRIIQAGPQRDEDIRILALELYDDGFIIRYALPHGLGEGPKTPAEASLNPMGLASLSVRDDVGTAYAIVGGGAGGAPAAHGMTRYAPAVPVEASWLDVLTAGGFVRFDL